MKTAIIDIGSNTVRLVIYRYDKKDGLHEFGNIKTVARLRTFILPNGEMSEEGIQLLSKTLTTFKKILHDYHVTNIQAVATAAIRQATNNSQIILRMEEETGIKINILSEREEAYFGFLAVANSMSTSSAVTIDIGGGSTEITLFNNKILQKTWSFPFGTVSLKQKFVSNGTISEVEKQLLRKFLLEQFESLQWIQGVGLPIIAIGGSARNVVQVHQQKVNYPLSGIHQYEMTIKDINDLKNELGVMTLEELRQVDGLSSDRADIILLALEVFSVLMEIAQTSQFQLSKKGLREGLIINQVLQVDENAFDKNNVFEENVRRIAYQYGRSEEETNTLYTLAKQFYEESCRLQLVPNREEHLNLLTKAAKVFAIGEYIELESASQHTFYLLANQSIVGMNHIERIKLALLASYKNRDYFRRFSQPFAAWISREELKELRDLGAMLKFVYALNVSKSAIVSDIKMMRMDEQLQIILKTKGSAVAENYEAEKQKKHIERVFKLPVSIRFIEERGNNK